MYIRAKARKNKSGKINYYAYLVASKRRKRSSQPPKQKVLAYLGRVIILKDHKQENEELPKNPKEAILKLFQDVLTANGFKQKTKFSYIKEHILVDLADKEVVDLMSGQEACLKVNEGFMARPTLKKALEYKPPEATEKEIGRDLAKTLVSAGLKPSEALFLALFRNLLEDFHRK